MHPDKFYEQRHEQLGHLPGDILLSLAVNENAEWRFRKAAVEIMLEHGFQQAYKPEVAALLKEVKDDQSAKEEVRDVVETAIEVPLVVPPEKPNYGPLFASVTTETL